MPYTSEGLARGLRALVQRVSRGSVSVGGQKVGAIGRGLVILLGVRNGDTDADAEYLADKCIQLRIFPDEEGKFDRSCVDVGGEVLVVSQFTLYGDTRKGRRPSFVESARPEISEPLYLKFIEGIRRKGMVVEQGVFGAMMELEIHNDGPVTLMIESKAQ